jgi:kinesin family member C1
MSYKRKSRHTSLLSTPAHRASPPSASNQRPAQARVKELEGEAIETKGVRRKLHDMVQELKRNIRVFCRVRPMLSSDEGEEGGREVDMRYPDRRDHREIVLSSTSEI